MKHSDFAIIGGGIIGLTLAREALKRHPRTRITIYEQENALGKHASGHNSGVLHSGIFYPETSLKAKVCAKGAKSLTTYCQTNNLPIKAVGKLILPNDDGNCLDIYHQRASQLGWQAQLLDSYELNQLEPSLKNEKALFLPEISIIEPLALLKYLRKELENQGVQFNFNSKIQSINTKNTHLMIDGRKTPFGVCLNASGTSSAHLAHSCGVAQHLQLLPFKGSYWQLSPQSNTTIKHLVYPAPDPLFPFLGVHFTPSIDNDIYIGPTALPTLKGSLNTWNAINILLALFKLYTSSHVFRKQAHSEIELCSQHAIFQEVSKLTPNVRKADILPCRKAGIRPQLFNTKTNQLVHDFLIEKQGDTIHVLNAISPGLTCSFAFSEHLFDLYHL